MEMMQRCNVAFDTKVHTSTCAWTVPIQIVAIATSNVDAFIRAQVCYSVCYGAHCHCKLALASSI